MYVCMYVPLLQVYLGFSPSNTTLSTCAHSCCAFSSPLSLAHARSCLFPLMHAPTRFSFVFAVPPPRETEPPQVHVVHVCTVCTCIHSRSLLHCPAKIFIQSLVMAEIDGSIVSWLVISQQMDASDYDGIRILTHPPPPTRANRTQEQTPRTILFGDLRLCDDIPQLQLNP